jgi:hypothetical protein
VIDPTCAPALSQLDDFLVEQDGVVARHQVTARGYTAAFIRRKVRRREWARVYPGVYVNHTGPLTWRQRAWCAVLDAHPAALSHRSALNSDGTPDSGPIHIVVDRSRRVTRRPGVVVHYGTQLEAKVMWETHPPRMRVEQAVLDVAAEARSETDVIACLADAVNSRKTTADRLIGAIRDRPRMRRREFVAGVLDDVANGTCSVLEHGYLVAVERRHGLPEPARQAATTVGRRGFRDVDYVEWGLVIELDGRAAHDDSRNRDLDLQRDLDAAVDAQRQTLRVGWGQVFDRPCQTARQIGQVLRARGWDGAVTPCTSCPTAS